MRWGHFTFPSQHYLSKNFPSPLNWFGTFFKIQVVLKGRSISGICIWFLLSVCLSVLRPISHLFEYCSFVLISVEIRLCKSSNFFFFFKIISALGPLHFHIHFRNSLSIMQKRQNDHEWGKKEANHCPFCYYEWFLDCSHLKRNWSEKSKLA